MYIPPSFSQDSPEEIRGFVRRNSFATLISNDGTEPAASHLPLLLDENGGEHGYLLGHFARANPQWQSLEGQTVLAIFSGPHAYISPTSYGEEHTVPTWNYTAVHIYGVCRLIQQPDQVGALLADLVQFYEQSRPQPWRFDRDTDFSKKLAAQVVGFRIEVSRWEAKWKLGQNHSAQRRQRVIESLEREQDHNSLAIAELMQATLD